MIISLHPGTETLSRHPARKPSALGEDMPGGTRTQAKPSAKATVFGGTRSIERTLQVIKALGSRGAFGWRLSDLAEELDLDRGTCHRVLACLVREGFAQRYTKDLKYYPGQLIYEMGVALPHYTQFRELVEPRMERLGLATGCIASLSLRNGDEVVCVFQKRCGIDLAAMMIQVGTRRPLIGCAGGLAILKVLNQTEAAKILDRTTTSERSLRGTRRLDAFARMEARSDGKPYAYTAGDLAPNIAAIAIGLKDAADEPFAALTLTGSLEALNPQTTDRIHDCMREVALEIESDATRCFLKRKR